MGLGYWNLKEEPGETYLGWDIYYEFETEIGQTTGMPLKRARAVKNKTEIVYQEKNLSSFKLRKYAKEQLKYFEDYKEDLKNYK